MPRAGGPRAAANSSARPAKKAAAAGSSTSRAKKASPPARRPAKKAAAAGSSTPSTSRTGLQLDPANPDDAKIMARQRKAAAAAGSSGQDRQAVTGGRPDLQDAFDEGAQGAGGEEGQEEGGPGAGERAKNAAGAAGEFLSRGSWSPTLRPPARARDAGGLAFGLLIYTAVITYIRYGPAGWTGWLSAKFLNKPLQGLPGKGGPAKKDVKA